MTEVHGLAFDFGSQNNPYEFRQGLWYAQSVAL